MKTRGVLIALGNFPDGNATATRMRFIAKTCQAGDIDLMVAVLQPTLKHSVPENNLVSGVVDGIRFRYLSGNIVRPNGLAAAFMDTLRGIIGGVRLLAFPKPEERADFAIFYTPSFLKHGLPILVAYLKGIPIFIEACEIRSKTTGGNKRHAIGRLLNFTENWMEWISPRIAAGIIPISYKIADFYREQGIADDKLFLLPILMDADVYTAPSTEKVAELEEKTYFLNSGSFVEKDGVEYIVQAFIKVLKTHPGVYLVFTGKVSDDDKEKVYSAMRQSSVPENAIFPGMLSRPALVWAYQHALGLLSCRSNSLYANYGFPTKVGEYMAAGSPVISTRVGDAEIYMEDRVSAVLADPENSESIAESMAYLVENSERAKAIGLKGREVALNNFDYRCHATTLGSFIEERL